jgi:SET domain
MTAAGNELFGTLPLVNCPQLFATEGQFICTYATQQHQISANAARTSTSRFLWSTNRSNRCNPKALYFDAATAPFYDKYLNDLWDPHANNCELRWNPATGRVEVYATRDILLDEELGMDYGAPFWYQKHNGLTTREQAQQVQAYYKRLTPPWYAKPRRPQGPPAMTAQTPPLKSPTPAKIIDLRSPPAPSQDIQSSPP